MQAIVDLKLVGQERSSIHTFERAGLGKAPFRFTGNMTEEVFCTPGGTPRAGASCDYCGTGIRYAFWVKSSDGKVFKVGCDCIRKTGDAGLIAMISKAERELRDLKNKRAKEAKKAREQTAIDQAKSILPAIRGRLAEQPHPNPYFADQGRTLLDYVNWCFDNRAGMKAVGIIKSVQK